jgi:hypothetical protein
MTLLDRFAPAVSIRTGAGSLRALAAPVLVAVALGVSAPAEAQSTFTIRTSNGAVARVGAFHPRRSATLASAIRAFGRPSSTKLTRSACLVEWRRLRLRMTFTTLGAFAPGESFCTPSVGLADSFTARGTRFRTSAGLRVGSPSSSVAAIYPSAEFRSGSWWLVTAVSPFGDQSEYPVIRAIVGGGRVRALVGFIGAEGE